MLARKLFPLFKIRNIKKSCGILDLGIGKSTADGFNTVVENQRQMRLEKYLSVKDRIPFLRGRLD